MPRWGVDPTLTPSPRRLHLSRKGRCAGHQEPGPWGICLWREESLDFGETPCLAKLPGPPAVWSSCPPLFILDSLGIILSCKSDHTLPSPGTSVTSRWLQVQVLGPQCDWGACTCCLPRPLTTHLPATPTASLLPLPEHRPSLLQAGPVHVSTSISGLLSTHLPHEPPCPVLSLRSSPHDLSAGFPAAWNSLPH